MFEHNQNELIEVAQYVLKLAQKKGATSAELDLSESIGQNIQVRLQDIEQIEYQQDQSLDITVYIGQQKGRASTADLSPLAIEQTVQAACDIARYTAQDPYSGLADESLMAKNIPDLDKYHPWHLSTDEAVLLAKQCEQAALDSDTRIQNSDGASVSTGHFQFVYANSHDFCQHQQGTRHSISCSVLAADEQGMERNYWYDLSCDPQVLDTPENIGRIAAMRTVQKLGARSVPTGHYPVLFDTMVSGSLIGHIVGALSGGALYRESSFLLNSLGTQVLPEFVQLREEPHIPRTLGSTYFDNEGVATQSRFIVENGIIQGYFLGSYSARKLGMKSTGNAGGAHNLYLHATHACQVDLLRQMGTGLWVTDLMGQGVNMITGDYSRGAAGFWVENGVVAYPVSGITIANNLNTMLRQVVGIADDSLPHSASKIGSILLESMTVAGE